MKNWKSLLAAASLIAFASGASAAELNIYAWSGELPQEIVDDFAKETGITVTFDTYDSNETMMAKLSAGASGYDLIEPSQYTVQVLAKQGLIMELWITPRFRTSAISAPPSGTCLSIPARNGPCPMSGAPQDLPITRTA